MERLVREMKRKPARRRRVRHRRPPRTTEEQRAACHWVGLSTDLTPRADETLACPICNAPFARYPQRAEHLWSDPY
jgi:hypothetical protein